MYVIKEGNFYVMRQKRFKGLNPEHPHDACAYAVSVQQMHEMCDKYWPNADYSAVEEVKDE